MDEKNPDHVPRLTNAAFGASIGVTESYASYLKSGHRRPSGDVLLRIVRTYRLDKGAAMDAYSAGPAEFSALLRREVFKAAE